MYKELVADHAAKFSHCLYPCTVDTEQFVALVEWCISNCENQTWCWYPESTQNITFCFENETDCVQFKLT
jgi:hypothetical protein